MEARGLTARLAAAGLDRHAAAILALARPSLGIEPSRGAPGRSHFGGAPELPAGFAWPEYQGKPLRFLAQIDLGALPNVGELPGHGSLAFFYETEAMKWGFDPDDRGCARVAWIEHGPLRATTPPVPAFEACPLTFSESIDLPHASDLLLEPIAQQMTDAQSDAYWELLRSLYGDRYHHLLGHPQLVQNDMRLECELASNGIHMGGQVDDKDVAAHLPAAGDWQLLLQLDTDENGPGWMWGDAGRIYFWIRQQDLAARRFDRTWLILQCH